MFDLLVAHEIDVLVCRLLPRPADTCVLLLFSCRRLCLPLAGMHMQFVQVVLPTMQGDPIEWVSDHRYHHAHTDTPLDPHSPYDGYFWAHMGWLWDNEVCGPILHVMFHITVFLVTSICLTRDMAT